MSRESMQWLNRNVLRGHTDKLGHAWHYMKSMQGEESNHYPGAIPVKDLYRRLFGFTAIPRPLYIEMDADMGGGLTMVDGQVAWIRNDTGEVLGIHSDGYNGHQYGEWLVKNVETVLGDGLEISSAGLLRNGAVAWVQVARPDNIETPEGVTIRPYLLATTSFDGSIATTYKDGYISVVCDNTRDAFLSSDGNTFRIKHTSRSGLRVMEARQALGIIDRKTDQVLSEISALCAVDVSDAAWSRFMEAHAPISEDMSRRAVTLAETKREDLTGLWNNDVRVSPWRGTAWGVIQATNTYQHHIATIRNVERAERNMLRAVKGEWAQADRAALVQLAQVCDLGEIGERVLAGAAA